MNQPKFDIQEIIRTYTPPCGDAKEAVKKYLNDNGFVSDEGVTALIGTGGTISSAYSPTHETIVPVPSQPAYGVLREIQKWGVNQTLYTAIDVFAKDSRDIETKDLTLLLDVLSCAENKKVIITSGTYMLPKITELLFTLFKGKGKTIIVTGSTLPLGFSANDAGMNVLSAATLAESFSRLPNYENGAIAAVFHGIVFDTIDSIRAMNLHPAGASENCLLYPMGLTPIVPVKQVGAVRQLVDQFLGRLFPSQRPSSMAGTTGQNVARHDR